MGLTSWRGAGVRKQDVAIAKNYLTERGQAWVTPMPLQPAALIKAGVIRKGRAKRGRTYF